MKTTFLWPLAPAVLLIVVFEILIRQGVIADYLVPTPTAVFAVILSENEELFRALLETALGAGLGFFLASTGGVLLGIIFSQVSWLQKSIYPYAIFFQTVPIIAIAPLLVIWLGFGLPTIVASSLIVGIFPVIASTLLGLQSTEPAFLDLFRLYGASRWQTLWKLRMPAAQPQIFNGLRICAGLSVIGAIVGEFVAGGGLGGIIDVARMQQRVDQVFAAIVLATLIGVVFVALTRLLTFLSLRRWHPSEN